MPEPEQIQPASTQVLDTEFKLAFDPALANDPDVREIFESTAGRALWLFLRRDHLASQHFNESVRLAAKAFVKFKPQTLDAFKNIFLGMEDPAVAAPWGGNLRMDEEDKRQRDAKLSFLMEAMYGRISLRVHTGLLQK